MKDNLLIAYLGACIFGAPDEFYYDLKDNERIVLKKQAQRNKLMPWFYRYLYRILPNNELEQNRIIFYKEQALALYRKAQLKRLCDLFINEKIHFILIKGCDLAYRLYPDAALRNYNDWDILFHPDDINAAVLLLKDNKWETFDNSCNSKLKKVNPHHFGPLYKESSLLSG